VRQAQAEIQQKRQRTKQKVDEKVAVAQQTLEMINSHIAKLDADLGVLDMSLRSAGEFLSGTCVTSRM
jgi:hypothetical protein